VVPAERSDSEVEASSISFRPPEIGRNLELSFFQWRINDTHTERHSWQPLRRARAGYCDRQRRDVSFDRIDDHIKNELHLSGLNAFFTRLVFKTTLLKNAYTRAEIENLVAQTSFPRLRIDEEALGMNIWLEK
jgi:hypothetical protein